MLARRPTDRPHRGLSCASASTPATACSSWRRYPGKKIIVWTHNFHAVRSAATLNTSHPPYARQREKHPDTPLGEVAVRELEDELCSIAVIAGRGWYTPNASSGDTVTRADIGAPAAGSLEHGLLERDVESGYLNLATVEDVFTMNGVEHDTPITTRWWRVFDGVIYLRDMVGLPASSSEC